MLQETLEIPVTYKGKELALGAHALRVGYVNHIIVDVHGTPITIERDEEGNYRALIAPEDANSHKLDLGLIKALVKVLESL